MKRVTALILTLALLCGIPTVAFGKSSNRIEGFVDNQTLADAYGLTGSGRVKTDRASRTVTYPATVKPGYKDYINLSSDLFAWEDDVSEPITETVLRDNGVSPHVVFESGDDAVEQVSIDYHQRQIVIQYATSLVSTEPVAFAFNVHLVINGKRYQDRGVDFTGTLENKVVSVSKGPSVDLSAGAVAEAKADIAKIRVDLGGASVTTAFEKGKKYYGACMTEPQPSDYKTIEKYPNISKVISLRTIGLDNVGATVKLEKTYARYYVYDKDMNYLGRGDKQLPYHDKYYVSKRKLDV